MATPIISALRRSRAAQFHIRPGPVWQITRGQITRSADLVVALLVALIVSSAVYFGQDAGGADGKPPFVNPLKPSHVYALIYAATAFYLVILMRGLPRLWTGIAPFMLALGALHLLWLPFGGDDPQVARMFVLRMNGVVIALCFQVILSLAEDMAPLLATIRAIISLTAALNVLVVLAPDIFTVSMGAYVGRAAGLFGDPNICATLISLLTPLACHGCGLRNRLIYYALGAVAVFFTFSRSGVLLYGMAVTLDLVVRPGVRRQALSWPVRWGVLILFCALVGMAAALMWSDIVHALSPYLTPDTLARMRGLDEGSGAERVEVLRMGADMFAAHPVFGAGLAATRVWTMPVSVHNMTILFGAEFGILGILWFLAFLWRLHLFPARYGLVIGPLVAVQSLFTHSYFDIPYYIMVFLLYWRLGHAIRSS